LPVAISKRGDMKLKEWFRNLFRPNVKQLQTEIESDALDPIGDLQERKRSLEAELTFYRNLMVGWQLHPLVKMLRSSQGRKTVPINLVKEFVEEHEDAFRKFLATMEKVVALHEEEIQEVETMESLAKELSEKHALYVTPAILENVYTLVSSISNFANSPGSSYRLSPKARDVLPNFRSMRPESVSVLFTLLNSINLHGICCPAEDSQFALSDKDTARLHRGMLEWRKRLYKAKQNSLRRK